MLRGRGARYFVSFADGMCSPFRLSVFLLFLTLGNDKKVIFLQLFLKRGNFSELAVISLFSSVLCYLFENTFRGFFLKPSVIWRENS